MFHNDSSFESLQCRVTLSEAEADLQRQTLEEGLHITPLWQERWEYFKRQMRPGDELWFYEYVSANMAGNAGYCIRRGNQTVTGIATIKNES